MRWFNWFRAPASSNTPKPAPLTAQLDLDVPRYPPFMKGLPVVHPDKLLASQQELLDRSARSVLVPRPLYELHYLGALRRFASYAHLLPASQSHHHRGAGGLLRHSMEVALWALQAGDKMLLAVGKTPAQRRSIEPRWQLTAFLAGLCHDVGKPATDVVVSSSDRTKVWKPLKENLHDWADSNGIDAYFLDWRTGRSKQHIALSNLIAERIISTDTLTWIEEGGTELIVWLMEALNGNPGAANPLYDLVLRADQASVERDLKSMGVAMAGYDLGVPVERHLTDIMRRFIKEGVWLVNEPGARVWNINGGIYIVWPAGGDEIAKQVKEDGVPGFPRTSDGILDMLLERQLAFVRDDENSNERFWKIAPDVLSVKIPTISLACIKLRDDALISSSPLAAVGGRVLNGGEEPPASGDDKTTAGASAASSASPAALVAAEPVPVAASGGTVHAPAVVEQGGAKTDRAAKGKPKAEKAEAPAGPSASPAVYTVNPETGEITGIQTSKVESGKATSDLREFKTTGEGKKDLSNPMVIKLKSKNETQDLPVEQAPQIQREPSAQGEDSQKSTEEGATIKKGRRKKRDLSQLPTMVFDGAVGMMLLALADDLKSGAKAWGVDVKVDAEDMVHLRWPKACGGYGLTGKNILVEASSKDWIWVDPYAPLVRIIESEFEGEECKALRLNPEPSDAFLFHAAYDPDKVGGAKKPAARVRTEGASPQQATAQPRAQERQPSTHASKEERAPSSAAATSPAPVASQSPERQQRPPTGNTKPTGRPSTQTAAAPLQREIDLTPGKQSEPIRQAQPTPKPAQPPVGESTNGTGKNRDLVNKATHRTGAGNKPQDAGKMPGLLAVLSALDGPKSDDGWTIITRQDCSAACRTAGMELSRKELAALLDSSPDRLRQRGAFIYYNAP